MTMRPLALSALALAAVVGCGVPEGPAIARTDATPPKTPATTNSTPPKPDTTPKTPDVPVKAAEQDPAKLGEKVVDKTVGTGATAEPGDTLSMRYAGRLKSNGQEFDSNTAPGKPAFTFTLGSGQVIKGWDLGVKGMKVGGKRTLEIPADLGYGAQGQGDKIPANSDLVFDIELLDVEKASDATIVERSVIKPGTGPAIKEGDVVSITYKATLIDGTLVDNETTKPLQFKVGAPNVQVPGLNVALVGMKKGEVADVKIPPALGPRPGPNSGKIPPNSALKFEITVVSVG